MPGTIRLTGANAAYILEGSDTITKDVVVKFPEDGNYVTEDDDGNVEIDGTGTFSVDSRDQDESAIIANNENSEGYNFVSQSGGTTTAHIDTAGNIIADGAIRSGGDPYSGANVGSIIEDGGVVGCKAGNGSVVWAGYLKDTSNPTSRIEASGQSYFRNFMEVGTTSAPTPDYCFIGHSSKDSSSDYATFYARNMSSSGRTYVGVNKTGTATFEVFGNGDITGNITRVANIQLKLDPDDPTKVLDVKESIRNVQSALYRLKAAVLIPDTTVDQLRLRILEALETITEEVD